MAAADPLPAFLGFAGLGMGTLMLYASVKGLSVFGPQGILTTVLTTGKLPKTATTPSGIKGTGQGSNTTSFGQSGGSVGAGGGAGAASSW